MGTKKGSWPMTPRSVCLGLMAPPLPFPLGSLWGDRPPTLHLPSHHLGWNTRISRPSAVPGAGQRGWSECA